MGEVHIPIRFLSAAEVYGPGSTPLPDFGWGRLSATLYLGTPPASDEPPEPERDDKPKREVPPEGAVMGPTSAERREQARDLLTRAPRLRKKRDKK